jgi:hypothetical protein
MKTRHRKNWPYVRGNGDVTWMRAATEIAWASYLDSVGIEWVYEPRAIKLANGVRYVPDFYLPAMNSWQEVKGRETDEAMEKYRAFAQSNDCTLVGVRDIERAERVNDFETPAERIYCRAVAPVCGLAACFLAG